MTTLSIVLVAYNERERLLHVLRLLADEFSTRPEIIVVDNASVDQTSTAVQSKFPWARLVRLETNVLYGLGNNAGITVATGDLVMILNPDVSWEPGMMRAFVADMVQRPASDLAAPRLQYPGGRTQVSAHHRFPNLLTVFTDYCLPLQQACLRLGWHPQLLSPAAHAGSRPIAHATGVCLLVRRRIMTDIGLFDPEFSMYLEETDWQKRMAQAGLSRWLLGTHSLTHFGSAQKTFAQATRHYLWGLQRYTDKHWTARARMWLRPTIWIGTATSLIFLVLAWPFSLVYGRSRSRVQHYIGQYGKLCANLIRYPRHRPSA